MDNIITYRIFYWVPNTLSGERIAIGLCLFDKVNNCLATHWVAQQELDRLEKVFSQSQSSDTRDVLDILRETDANWKSKVYDASFWNYIERYWNGILQISAERKLYYEGSETDFSYKSEMLRNQLLPLSKPIT